MLLSWNVREEAGRVGVYTICVLSYNSVLAVRSPVRRIHFTLYCQFWSLILSVSGPAEGQQSLTLVCNLCYLFLGELNFYFLEKCWPRPTVTGLFPCETFLEAACQGTPTWAWDSRAPGHVWVSWGFWQPGLLCQKQTASILENCWVFLVRKVIIFCVVLVLKGGGGNCFKRLLPLNCFLLWSAYVSL